MQRVPHTPGPHSSFDFDSGLSGGDLSPYSAHAYPSQGLAHDHNGYIHEDQGPHAIYAYAQPNHSPSSLESQQYSTPGSFFPSETLPLPESAIEPITTDPIFGQAHPHDDEATVAVEPLQDALPPPHYRVVGSQRTTDAAHKRRKHDGRTMKLYRCPICQQELTSNANLSGHINSHVGIKPYVCRVHNKAYSQKQSLQRHRRKCHPCDLEEHSSHGN